MDIAWTLQLRSTFTGHCLPCSLPFKIWWRDKLARNDKKYACFCGKLYLFLVWRWERGFTILVTVKVGQKPHQLVTIQRRELLLSSLYFQILSWLSRSTKISRSKRRAGIDTNMDGVLNLTLSLCVLIRSWYPSHSGPNRAEPGRAGRRPAPRSIGLFISSPNKFNLGARRGMPRSQNAASTLTVSRNICPHLRTMPRQIQLNCLRKTSKSNRTKTWSSKFKSRRGKRRWHFKKWPWNWYKMKNITLQLQRAKLQSNYRHTKK